MWWYLLISCATGVAGDRAFSKWGGSVLDSVVGAFLTQNVSDYLSRQVDACSDLPETFD